MALSADIQGTMLDTARLLAYDFDTPINVLILYDKSGQELKRLDHFWSIGRPKKSSKSKNADEEVLTIAEDSALGEVLDDYMGAVKAFQYVVARVEGGPFLGFIETLSDRYETEVANRPEGGKPRVWTLTVVKTKFRSKFMGPS
jgi:hypothetical protein